MNKMLLSFVMAWGLSSPAHSQDVSVVTQQALSLPGLAGAQAKTWRLVDKTPFLSALVGSLIRVSPQVSRHGQSLLPLIAHLSASAGAWTTLDPHAGVVLAGILLPSQHLPNDDERLISLYNKTTLTTFQDMMEKVVSFKGDRQRFVFLKTVARTVDSFDDLVEEASDRGNMSEPDAEALVRRLRQALIASAAPAILSKEKGLINKRSSKTAAVQKRFTKTLARWAALHRLQGEDLFSHRASTIHPGASRAELRLGDRRYALEYQLEDDHVVRIFEGLSWTVRSELAALDVLLIEILFHHEAIFKESVPTTLVVDKPIKGSKLALTWMNHLKNFNVIRHLEKKDESKVFRSVVARSWFPVALEIVGQEAKPKKDQAVVEKFVERLRWEIPKTKTKVKNRMEVSELHRLPLLWQSVFQLASGFHNDVVTPTIIAHCVLFQSPKRALREGLTHLINGDSMSDSETENLSAALVKVFTKWTDKPTLLKNALKRYRLEILPFVRNRQPTAQDLAFRAA